MKIEVFNMKMELSTIEIMDLLKNGSTNQRNFVNSLTFTEFNEFLEVYEMFFKEYDLRDLLNGGCLAVEEGGEINEYTIWENGRVTISLYQNNDNLYYVYYPINMDNTLITRR